MEQVGLWVRVSKSVCAFLEMHVFERKPKKREAALDAATLPPTVVFE
jgi:hypothetical protein